MTASNRSAFAPERFARDWVAAWNRSDADAVLSHFADDVVFVSPLAATVTGNAEVRGKSELRAYWARALALSPAPPEFLLDSLIWDERNRVLLILYVSTESARKVRKCELMYFRPDGLIRRGEAFAGAVIG